MERDRVSLAWTDDPRLRDLKGVPLDRAALRAAQARALANAILETGRSDADVRPNPRALPNDPARLRGIPCVGYGIRGAITGTRPEEALHKLARELGL